MKLFAAWRGMQLQMDIYIIMSLIDVYFHACLQVGCQWEVTVVA